jgi:hypothetical protein
MKGIIAGNVVDKGTPLELEKNTKHSLNAVEFNLLSTFTNIKKLTHQLVFAIYTSAIK